MSTELLLAILDKSSTASGARELRRVLAYPLTNLAKINNRLDKVEFFLSKY